MRAFFASTEGRRPRLSLLHLVVVVGLMLGLGGTATAASLITSKNIKDNTIQSRDVKDGSLLLKDFAAAERAKLKGATGATGSTGATGAAGDAGARGASAFDAPPAGTVIRGGGTLSAEVSTADVELRSYAPLPFTPTGPLVDDGANRNLFFGDPLPAMAAGEDDATSCPGTYDAPGATAGKLCVFLSGTEDVKDGTADLWSGANYDPDGAESNGFFVRVAADGPGTVTVPYVWTYQAP